MAIERTYIGGSSTAAAAAAKLSTYLNENAVPTYFDRVELNSDTVSCYVGDVRLLRCIMYINITGNGVTISTESGTTYTDTVDKSGADFEYAYKCNKGISFTLGLNFPFLLTITKDNNGNTTIIYGDGNYFTDPDNSKSSSQRIYVVNKDCQNIVSKSFFCRNDAERLTVLCPLPVGDTTNYTPDAFLMPYTQYTVANGIIDVDGCKYLSNGLWCVRDGGVAGE